MATNRNRSHYSYTLHMLGYSVRLRAEVEKRNALRRANIGNTVALALASVFAACGLGAAFIVLRSAGIA